MTLDPDLIASEKRMTLDNMKTETGCISRMQNGCSLAEMREYHILAL